MDLGLRKFQLAIIFAILYTISIAFIPWLLDTALTSKLALAIAGGYTAIVASIIYGQVLEVKNIIGTNTQNLTEEKIDGIIAKLTQIKNNLRGK